MNQFENGFPSANYNEANTNTPSITENDEVLEMGEDFDFEGFQVVRREFFAHMREPSVCFNNYKFYVNAACLAKFPNCQYAQVLINRNNKILALRPCPDEARDAFKWCNISEKDGKRKPRQITCKLFFAKIFSLMEWDTNHRYKILGNIIHSNDEYLLAFDLTSTEVYQRTSPEGEKHKTARVPVFPAEWQDQFGLPFAEHQKAMKINIVDSYAVYSIQDTKTTGNNEEREDNTETETDASVVPMLPETIPMGGGGTI
ncbi:MAG: hypothetical protein K5768_09185 [Firmicutes bacterium]|jgi:hypothetical protein|nr:hypothetical protein [Bacillota bacterium]